MNTRKKIRAKKSSKKTFLLPKKKSHFFHNRKFLREGRGLHALGGRGYKQIQNIDEKRKTLVLKRNQGNWIKKVNDYI